MRSPTAISVARMCCPRGRATIGMQAEAARARRGRARAPNARRPRGHASAQRVLAACGRLGETVREEEIGDQARLAGAIVAAVKADGFLVRRVLVPLHADPVADTQAESIADGLY